MRSIFVYTLLGLFGQIPVTFFLIATVKIRWYCKSKFCSALWVKSMALISHCAFRATSYNVIFNLHLVVRANWFKFFFDRTYSLTSLTKSKAHPVTVAIFNNSNDANTTQEKTFFLPDSLAHFWFKIKAWFSLTLRWGEQIDSFTSHPLQICFSAEWIWRKRLQKCKVQYISCLSPEIFLFGSILWQACKAWTAKDPFL